MGHFAIANWLYFESISQVHIIWVILNVALFLYVNYLMFFCNKGVTLQLLLSLSSSSSNHQGRTSLRSFFIFPSHHLFGGRKVNVVHWIQHRLLPFARGFFVAANLVINLVCLGYVLQFHRRVAQLGLLERSFFSSLAYASFLLHCLLYVSLGRLNAELKYRYILRLRAIWARLTDEGKLSAHFSEFRLKRHLNYIAEVLHFLADFNRLYGRMLWATLLVVYPDNATKWIVLLNSTFSGRRQHQQLLQTMSPLIRFALLQDALIVLLFAKLVHYKAARLTWPLYGCARYATRVAVRSGKVRGGGRLGPRARLK
ncbi:hypothetical protein TYRP_003577 [Tyrophagus putrescentiae]|nr:hypothetical protein TYRP_003577 [Tyrophagus putrescentiae]